MAQISKPISKEMVRSTVRRFHDPNGGFQQKPTLPSTTLNVLSWSRAAVAAVPEIVEAISISRTECCPSGLGQILTCDMRLSATENIDTPNKKAAPNRGRPSS